MPKLRNAILDSLSKACSGTTQIQPAQAKDILKLALVAARQTKRVVQNDGELSSAWESSKWSDLSSTLASSDRFKASVGLQAMCKQIVQLLQDDKAGSKASGKKKEKSKAIATKRKAEDAGVDAEDTGDSGKKAKHKKAKKAKSG